METPVHRLQAGISLTGDGSSLTFSPKPFTNIKETNALCSIDPKKAADQLEITRPLLAAPLFLSFNVYPTFLNLIVETRQHLRKTATLENFIRCTKEAP